jgi:hypothetical protein
MSAVTAFALAAALHAGFQLTVTVVVYPALAARSADEWTAAHARHSRAVTPVVAVVYGALVVTGVALVVTGPGPAGWVALAGAATAIGLTAAVAAPAHGQLSRRDERLLARLLVADRGRCAAALVALVAAALSVAGTP